MRVEAPKKKRRLALTAAVAAVFLLCAGAFGWGAVQMGRAQRGEADPGYIDADAALAAACADAGLTAADVIAPRCELDRDDGEVPHYEVGFIAGLSSHEYEIDCRTGAVLKHECVTYGQPEEEETGPELIGSSAALSAACGHAEVSPSDVTSVRVELDRDEGRVAYKVEFTVPLPEGGWTEYEYEISAVSGEVVGFEKKVRSDGAPASPSPAPSASASAAPSPVPSSSASPSPAPSASPSPSPVPSASPPPAQPVSYIGEAAAKDAAYAHAGCGAGDVSGVTCELDCEDGRAHCYEVEFSCGGYDYEYEIDCYTGAVLKHECESGDRHGGGHHGGMAPIEPIAPIPSISPAPAPSSSQGAQSMIGESAALSAAYAHAGVSAADVTGVKAELDRDDGRTIYEVEFRVGGTEYEYEIDAGTGAVLHYEIDTHD